MKYNRFDIGDIVNFKITGEEIGSGHSEIIIEGVIEHPILGRSDTDFNTDAGGYIVRPVDKTVRFYHARFNDTGQHWTPTGCITRVVKKAPAPQVLDEDLFIL